MSDSVTQIQHNHPDFEIASEANRLLGDAYIKNPKRPNLLQRLHLQKYKHYLHKLESEEGTELLNKLENEIRDPLTGLYNRRYLKEKLAELKPDDKYTLVMIDGDRFKAVNDRFGHNVGDEVLRHLALMLINHVRINDIVCRFGGEEFVILFNNTSQKKVNVVLDRLELLRKNVEAVPTRTRIKAGENFKYIPLTISIGLAVSAHGLSPDDVLKRADSALYAAKNSGRNKVVEWTDGMQMVEN